MIDFGRRCLECKPSMHRGRAANGSWQVFMWCPYCQRRTESRNIPHREVRNLEALPIAWDNTEEAELCERCGSSEGTELHHWAPRHLFEDADEWPMSWLCVPCHLKWHQVVTPNMSERRAEFQKFVQTDPSEGMVVTDLEDWEQIEYERWCREQDSAAD